MISGVRKKEGVPKGLVVKKRNQQEDLKAEIEQGIKEGKTDDGLSKHVRRVKGFKCQREELDKMIKDARVKLGIPSRYGPKK